jgi:hypothetical protein
MKEELILLATVLAVLSLSAIGAETKTRSTAQSSNFVTRAFDALPSPGCRFPTDALLAVTQWLLAYLLS